MLYIALAAVILAAVTLILALPVSLDARYAGGDLSLTGRIGPVPVKLLPRRRVTEKEVEKDTAREGEKLWKRLPPLPVLRILAKNGWEAADRLICGVEIMALRLYYTAGGPNLYDAAMAYARAGVAMEALSCWAQDRVEHPELRASVDFEAERSAFEGRICFAARLGRIVHIGACFGIGFLRGYFRYKKTIRSEG